MKKIAVIGGTGSGLLFATAPEAGLVDDTPFGRPSSAIRVVATQKDGYRSEIGFLARHGPDGLIPPHQINYRANLWLLKQYAPDGIVSLNAVGGIAKEASSARLYFPDQLIDYTWGREHTYSDGRLAALQHVDFTMPFDEALREHLIGCARKLELDYCSRGTYGVTQGPRLETSAEIDRLERDGCDIVGMTAMPEAALARELDMAYAVCAIVVNRAAGRARGGEVIHDEIQRCIEAGMTQVDRLLALL